MKLIKRLWRWLFGSSPDGATDNSIQIRYYIAYPKQIEHCLTADEKLQLAAELFAYAVLNAMAEEK